ncbi:helix-turn-helix transcriptional regulator [Gynurincola endophyticus]|uniref:helix-turn-helix transcriptional regulator n=1 Tax=Gynurincola endophyticus TaxID=2479004 RepID=UPI000F8C7B18|nr:AraC family transcriptional regulator [Gynurincola endophyticus]
MIIKSKIKGLDEWLFIEDIPDQYTPNKSVSEKKVVINRSPVRMDNFQLSSSGIFLLYSEMKCEEPVRIRTEVLGETVTSHFIFYKQPSFKKLTISGRSRHNIRYIPNTVQEYEMKDGIEYSYFLMVLSKDYYFHLINRHSSLHEDFVQEIEKGKHVSIAPNDMPVTPEMSRVISELQEGQKSGEIRRLHTEAKVMELLIYQLEQLKSSEEELSIKALRADDIEKLELVRSILEQNFIDPPSQKELSVKAGLNESKLRRSFKEYFGTTIHDYTVRIKMEYARKLLLEERKTIFEVSELTGFNHQNNFSSAFKKYFGISPSDIRY